MNKFAVEEDQGRILRRGGVASWLCTEANGLNRFS